MESAEDYDDGGDILGEDGDGVGRVEEMYDDEWVSGEHDDKAEDGMSLEHESDYNNVADGYTFPWTIFLTLAMKRDQMKIRRVYDCQSIST